MRLPSQILPLSASIALGAQTPSSSWGDSQSSGYRESATTSMFTPGRNAFDGNTTTYWQLSSGSTEGWVEAYAPTAQRYAGATINASIPAGAQLSFSILSNGSYIAIPGGTIQGPLDGSQSLLFPGELLPTTRVLVEVSGQGADQAKVYEIQWQLSGAPQALRQDPAKVLHDEFPGIHQHQGVAAMERDQRQRLVRAAVEPSLGALPNRRGG